MIGGLKLPRAGGIGVNANEVEDLPISLLLSPLTTRIPLKSVGARQDASAEAAQTVAAATRACLAISAQFDAAKGERVCHLQETDSVRNACTQKRDEG
jgi:hypothetical protein